MTRAKFRYLRALVAPAAAEARANAQHLAEDAALMRARRKAKLEFEREHAPHPLDEAVRLAQLAKQQDFGLKAKKTVESDVFVSGTSIAARKAPKNPAKF